MALLTDGITHGWDIRTEDIHTEGKPDKEETHIYTLRGHIRPPPSFPSCPIERSYYFFARLNERDGIHVKRRMKRKKKKDKKKKPLQICLFVADGGGGLFIYFLPMFVVANHFERF